MEKEEGGLSDIPLHKGRRDEEFFNCFSELLQSELNDKPLEKLRKSLNDAFDELYENYEYRVKEQLAVNLADYIQQMADRSIKSMLEGNESELRRYLTCEVGVWNGRDREQPMIHGKLFVPECFELRRQLVDAHADMIKSERILDLECQVRSLVEQNNNLEAKVKELLERHY